jgi:predicted nuclease with RNAse H fold
MGFDKLNLMRSVASERKVAGADCSGSKEIPNETWLALGTMNGNKLEITSIQKTGMHALGKELNNIADLSAAGIDCPFSLPAEYMTYLSKELEQAEFQTWQALAEQIVFMPFEKFQELAKAFKKEPKRVTDKRSCAQALSPLHRGYPSMIQMTYHGIRMLASLDPKRFYVLPFQEAVDKGVAVIEVYPRATLKCLGLPDTGYKSKEKKDHDRMQSARHKILHGLLGLQSNEKFKNCPRLVLPSKLEHQCVDSDHALDALLACYATALWLTDPAHCADPFESDDNDVLLEGWIYEAVSI